MDLLLVGNFLGELVSTRKIWVTSARERDFSPKLDVQLSANERKSIQRTASKTFPDGSPGAHNLFSAMCEASLVHQIADYPGPSPTQAVLGRAAKATSPLSLSQEVEGFAQSDTSPSRKEEKRAYSTSPSLD
jgi:hypothetical protein